MNSLLRTIIVVLGVFLPFAAFAHPGHTGVDGFLHEFAYPLAGVGIVLLGIYLFAE